MTAHVVVRTDGDVVRGVRFKAPIPGCFDAVFVQDVVPNGLFSIGDSQTGISIAIPGCTDLPTRVLDITYYSAGGTTPCCEFPLVADPLVGYLEAVDCSYTSIAMQSVTAYMNADSTCVCSVPETPPFPPANPYPADGTVGLDPTVVLQWTASDPASLDVTCDLYFGTTPNPPLVASDIAGYGAFNYALPRLAWDTVHYWKVVVRNLGGAETAGPAWQFTTRPNPVERTALLRSSTPTSTSPTCLLTASSAWNSSSRAARVTCREK